MSKETALIIRLREDVSRLKKDQARTRAMMSRHKKQLSGISQQIGTSLAGAFAGVQVFNSIKDSISKIADFEFQMDKVAAVSGATAKQLEKLQNNALQLGRDTKFTAGEIGKLQEELARLGFSTDKILDSTDAIRKLATVADAELGESAKSIAGTLNSFNLEATESERVANVMGESFAKSALDLEKFTVGMSNVGATANAAGVSLEMTTALMGKLVDSNIDASKAGTDLRKIFTELQLKGLTLEEALSQIDNSTNKVKTAFDLFGQRAQTSAIILADNQQAFQKLNEDLSDTNHELDSMVDVMEDNLLTDWQKFQSAIDGAIQKGSALNDFFRSVTQGATDFVNALNAENIDEWQKSLLLISPLFAGFIADQEEAAAATKDAQAAFYDQINTVKAARDAQRLYNEALENGVVNIDSIKKSIEAHVNAEKIKIELDKIAAQQQDQKTESLEKEVKAYQDLRAAKLAALQGFNPGDFQTEEFNGGLNEFRRLGQTLDSEMERFILSSGEANEAILEEQNKSLDQSISITEDYVKKYQETMNGLNSYIDGTLKDSLSNSISGIADVIGSGGGLGDAFDIIKGVLAGGMQSIGKAMIAYGIAHAAFQKALQGLNPFVAIAAGAAMVAAGAALRDVQGNFSSSFSGGGGNAGTSSTRSGSFTNDGFGQSREASQLTFKIEGKDLVAVLDKQSIFNSRG